MVNVTRTRLSSNKMDNRAMNKTRQIYCNTCQVDTRHKLDAMHIRYVSQSEIRQHPFIEEVSVDEPISFAEYDAVFFYNLWLCQGCGTATLQEACTARPLVNDDGMRVTWTYDFYPRRLAEGWQRKPFSMPLVLGITYQEVVESFNAGLVTLCSIGLRALLEGVCVDKGITDDVAWGLGEKIDKLGEYGHVPTSIAQSLKSFKFIGDMAAHRLQVPEPEDLRLAIEVMEELLTFLYSLEYKAQYLQGQMQQQ